MTAPEQGPVMKVWLWIATSVGAVGLLSGIGFVVDISYQDKLGFQIERSGIAARYVVLAGQMLFDWTSDTLTLGARYAWPAVGVVLVVAIAYAVPRLRSAFGRLATRFDVLLLATAVGVAFLKVFVLDYPTFAIRELLVVDPQALLRSSSGGVLATLQRRRFLEEICARVEGDVPPARLKAALVRCAAEGGDRHLSESGALDAMSSRNVQSGLATILVILSFAAAIPVTRRRSKGMGGPRARIPTALSGFLLVASLTSLATFGMAYGHARRDTVFDESIIYWDSPYPGDAEVHAWLLSSNDTEIVVFNKAERQIWRIPRVRLKLIKTERRTDVLSSHFRNGIMSVSPVTPP